MSWPTATCGPRPRPRRPRCSPGWRNMPTTRKRCGCTTCSAACCRAVPPCPPRPRPPRPPPPEPLSPEAALEPEDRAPSLASVARNAGLDRAVRDRAREGNATAALALINRSKGLSPAYAGLLRADLAIGLCRAGQDEEALRIAAEAARAGEPIGLAAFAAGLSAWGLGQYDTALPYFERTARNDQAAPALRAAAAFWTARAAVRARKPQ